MASSRPLSPSQVPASAAGGPRISADIARQASPALGTCHVCETAVSQSSAGAQLILTGRRQGPTSVLFRFGPRLRKSVRRRRHTSLEPSSRTPDSRLCESSAAFDDGGADDSIRNPVWAALWICVGEERWPSAFEAAAIALVYTSVLRTCSSNQHQVGMDLNAEGAVHSPLRSQRARLPDWAPVLGSWR